MCTTSTMSLSVIIRAFMIKSQYPVVELPLKFVLDYRFSFYGICSTLINNYFSLIFIVFSRVFYFPVDTRRYLEKFTLLSIEWPNFLKFLLPFPKEKLFLQSIMKGEQLTHF